jgi:hypothetical protein
LIDKDVIDENSGYIELVKHLHSETNNKDLPLTKVFDPREGLTIDDSMTKKYDEKLDQSMEVWAQAELDIIRVCHAVFFLYFLRYSYSR